MVLPFRQTQYRGYSTTGTQQTKFNEVFDVELVIANLFNHINTRKTERVRDANYGSILKDMIFEHKTDTNIQEIVDEVLRVIQTEPRVSIVNFDLNTDVEYQVEISVILLYQPLDIQAELKLSFDLENGIITGRTNTSASGSEG